MSERVLDSPWLSSIADLAGAKPLRVINPATGDPLANIPDMSAEQTAQAIESAARFVAANDPSLDDRRMWLANIASLLVEHKQELGRIITLEQGKPFKESVVEVEYSAGFFRYCSEHIDHLRPREMPGEIRGSRWTVHHRPAGVAALITPWNFPLAMLAKKLSAAIAGGCGIVIKPSEITPLSAIALCEVARGAGVPAEMVNLVLGMPEEIGRVLCTHAAVRVVSFTGSTRVGKLLMRQCADHVKRPLMELGGNAPFVVFADANIDAAADALIANKFRAAGQTCVCANRVYVQREALKAFTDAVVARAGKLNVGDGMIERTDIGPLINRNGFDKVRRHVADAIARGARRVLGSDPPVPAHDWGLFFPPTVLADVKPASLMCEEETFGPVVGIVEFSDETEALAAANRTSYGLAAYIFTQDDARIERLTRRLTFGHVAINSGTGPTPEAPFGGMKQSGIGREGGLEGLVEFCEVQTIARYLEA